MTLLAVLGRLLLELPIAVVTTLLAGRLLGARRSWLALTVAGALGWTAGNALQLDFHGLGGVGLSAATVAFSVFFTMLVALALDFAARPGTLARGERAGLILLPRPVRDLRRHVAPFVRYRELLAIARRNGLGAGQPLGPALRRTFEEGGVIFVKLGQMASTRTDLLPADVCRELSLLQNEVEPAPAGAMRRVLEDELGRPVEDIFADFDWKPLGSASIAQAYAARLATGEPVVVKVQRPGIEDVVLRDSAALLQLARLAERRTPQGRDLHVAGMVEEFVRSIRRELDFRVEATNVDALAAATSPDAGVRIPHVHGHLTTRRVLVEERFAGRSVAHLGIPGDEFDGAQLADRLVAAVVGHILSGDFHADLHPGNVLVLEDGALGLIDFGSIGHLDSVQRSAILQMTAGFLRQDAAALRDGICQVADVGDEVSDVALERALVHFLAEHGKHVNASALNDVIPLLATFDIRLPAELTTFFRAMALVDGTCRTMAPGYSVVEAMGRMLHGDAAVAAPVGTLEEQVKAQLVAELPRLSRLPALAEQIASQAARGRLAGPHLPVLD